MYNGSMCSMLFGITLIIFVIAHVHTLDDDKSRNGSVIASVVGDATVAEAKNPVKKYVSSGYKNGNEQGYTKKKSWKDGDGYDTLEQSGNSDKDKYGFISEEGFGSRKSGTSGKKPDVEKHSYKKTKKNGKDWEFRNAGGSDEESHEKTAGKGKGRKSFKKTFEKPIRYRKASSSSSNSPRSEKLVASPTDKLYDFSMTYDTPAVTGYQQQQQQQAAQRHTLPPLPRLTSSRTDLPYQPTNKRGAADTVSHLTDYGNGFQTQIYHNPNAFNQGPVLFTQQPVVASPEEATEEEGEELSEEKPKTKRRAGHLSSGANAKSRKGKKGGKGKPQKSEKYSEYDGLDGLNYDASVEADGGESEGGDYDNNDYSYNDYGESGEANDGGDYDEEENDGGEEGDSAEANEYDDYENNDYDYDGGEEPETKKPKKSKKKPDSESYELDSYGSFTKIVPDYHRGRFIYASEADKDATYR